MNPSHKNNKLKNRFNRLNKRRHDNKNPLNPRQIERLNELENLVKNK